MTNFYGTVALTIFIIATAPYLYGQKIILLFVCLNSFLDVFFYLSVLFLATIKPITSIATKKRNCTPYPVNIVFILSLL